METLIAITDNEMVYLQSCKNCTVKTNFIRCCQVERGTTPAIVDAIERAVTTVMTLSDFIPKLVALGSDGASVMLGKNAGVFSQLKERHPEMIAVHCCGHMLELACKGAMKKCLSR